MRVDVADEEQYSGEFALWQANCDRSMKGKKGHAALKEMERALVAMPVKEIYADVLVEQGGCMCAIGAVMVQRKIDEGMSREDALDECSMRDPECVETIAEKELGFPHMVAWSTAYENDWDGYRPDVTPAQRYERMLKWVRGKLGVSDGK